jgi:hypothetical protein
MGPNKSFPMATASVNKPNNPAMRLWGVPYTITFAHVYHNLEPNNHQMFCVWARKKRIVKQKTIE